MSSNAEQSYIKHSAILVVSTVVIGGRYLHMVKLHGIHLKSVAFEFELYLPTFI